MDKSKTPVILASQSPRRTELLKTIVEKFRIVPSNIDETCDTNLLPEENAILLASKKAGFVAKLHPHHLVIGADTLVVLKNKIIGKPNTPEDARQTLRQLSGQEHKVCKGDVVFIPGDEMHQFKNTGRQLFEFICLIPI